MYPARLSEPADAGARFRLTYTRSWDDGALFREVLDARPNLDVDRATDDGGQVTAEVTLMRDTDRLGRILQPTTMSGPDTLHELIEVVELEPRSGFATAWRASWDNITEQATIARDQAVIPAAEGAERLRKPLAWGGGTLALIVILTLAFAWLGELARR